MAKFVASVREVKFPIQTYHVRAYCECGGEFIFQGVLLPTRPPKYRHVCDRCGIRHDAAKQYPEVIHEASVPG